VQQELLAPIVNVFTPNGDGIGDFFAPRYSGNQSYELTVVDRWGNELFRLNRAPESVAEGWNANNAADGVYFYVLKIGKRVVSGQVTVVR
jgi:gliding motility-associated-like protein